MAQVTLESYKAHCHIEFDDDDLVLTERLAAAEEAVVRYTHRSVDELKDINNGDFPHSLRQAIVLTAQAWSEHGPLTQGGFGEMPYGAQTLAKPWRKLADDDALE